MHSAHRIGCLLNTAACLALVASALRTSAADAQAHARHCARRRPAFADAPKRAHARLDAAQSGDSVDAVTEKGARNAWQGTERVGRQDRRLFSHRVREGRRDATLCPFPPSRDPHQSRCVGAPRSSGIRVQRAAAHDSRLVSSPTRGDRRRSPAFAGNPLLGLLLFGRLFGRRQRGRRLRPWDFGNKFVTYQDAARRATPCRE